MTSQVSRVRKIVEIDESKCDGCGNCLPGCAEGALAIVDGKARIIKDMYCDGLGACLGHCPQDALRIVEREAEAFDEDAAMEHVARQKAAQGKPESGSLGCGCPGSAMREFAPKAPAAGAASGGLGQSQLGHWPVKLRLVPAGAPFLQGADLLLAADCAPVAAGGFHDALLAGRALALACPKFEDREASVAKLADILAQARPKSLTVARMEVPCCAGLEDMVRAALDRSGADVDVTVATIARDGTLVSSAGLGVGPGAGLQQL